MGGNTTILNKAGESISAERIPLKTIGRAKFVKSFQHFILNMNDEFKKDYGYYIWENKDEILNGGIFNGSTSFIMSPDFSDDEVIKYKSTAGDIDVAFPREFGKDVYNFLERIEGTQRAEFYPGIKYVGNNANSEDKLGNTLICIAKAQFDDVVIQAQLDLELSEMTNGVQSDWSKFAHSSSFEDAKAGMKGVANKYFWRALVGALHQLDDGFIVATPSSTPDKIKLKGKQPSSIRLLNFGVDSGVGAGYEIMMKDGEPLKIDNKTVYREKKPSEKTYDKNLNNLLKIVFGTDKIKYTDTHSFIKLLKLTNKYTDKKVKQLSADRFLAILFCNDGGQCQAIEPSNSEEDVNIKLGMYRKALEILNLKEDKNIDKYIKKYLAKTHGINETFRKYLGSL